LEEVLRRTPKEELPQLKSYRLVGGALIYVCALPQLEWVVGLLAGHCHLEGHLFKLRLGELRKCPGIYKEALTNTKVAIFKETYPEDKLTEDDQDSILKHWGRCYVGLQRKNYHN
jgi:hypothetical protein